MVPSHETFQNTKCFTSLDGLRCLSIMAVVWHHAGRFSFPEFQLRSPGPRGVELFFTLSGFLITTLLLREKMRHGDISLGKFYMRRVLRIFPLYYSVLLLYVVLVLTVERNSTRHDVFFQNLPHYLTYTSNWFKHLTADGVIFFFAWSLATEEQFYLVWPWIEKFAPGKLAVWIMFAIIATVEAAHFNVFDAVMPIESLGFRMLTSIAVPICLGVLLAHLLANARGYVIARTTLGFPGASLLALAFVLATLVFRDVPLPVAHLALALLVASCVVREDHWLAPVLRFRPIAHIGAVSYGMYLLHMLAYNFVEQLATKAGLPESPAIFFGLTMLFAAAAASFSFRYYEGFFLRMKDRYRPEI